LRVRDVECDEIWGWVGMKEKNKIIDTDLLGDAYCFVGIERNTKLILAWHLGRRSAHDTQLFTALVSGYKLNKTTDWNNRVDQIGSCCSEVPVKWAFSRKG